jgi:hypothetical protein
MPETTPSGKTFPMIIGARMWDEIAVKGVN